MSATATRLYLVRHGQAAGAAGLVMGHTDPPLSAAGECAVRTLALGMPALTGASVVTSDLARARATADLIAKAVGARTDAIEVDPRLRELHFGAWEGRSWDEIQRSDGARLGEWMAAWADRRTPQGEGYRDLYGRVADWARGLDERTGQVLVVAHAGSIRALLSLLLGITPQQAFQMRLDHAHVTAVALQPRSATCGAQLLYHNADHFRAALE